MFQLSNTASERALALDPNRVMAAGQLMANRVERGELTKAYAAAQALLKSRPDVGQEMCHLLSQRQDSLRKLNTEVPVPAGTEHTVLDWLREGMRKLHDLTT